MDLKKADRRITQITKISLVVPASSSGVGVSKQTGQPAPEPEYEPGVAVNIEVAGEPGGFAVEGEDAATIYKIIRERLAD